MNPETVGVVILLVVVLCVEARSFHRVSNVRRYEQSVKRASAK